MSVETAADRAAFLNADEFGVEASYTLAAGGSPVTISGILDEPAGAVAVGDGVSAIDARVTLLCRSSDLPAGAGEGDGVVIGARSWVVVVVEPDGQGMTLLTLGKS